MASSSTDHSSSSMLDDQTQKLEEFMSHLQQERLKIEAFKRELPLCMHLLTNAMEESKKQLQSCKLDSQAPTPNPKPPVVLEQFIPWSEKEKEKEKEKVDKSHWMTSVQLWNPTSTTSSATCNNGDPAAATAFLPFGANNEQKGTPELEVSAGTIINGVRSRDQSSNSCSRMTMMMINQQQQQQHTNRKTRRCWSPDLHRRFLNALHMLGGSEVATPKQIRELMKVDGLTNDEVKSHLQKYRLHTRRPGPAASSMAGDGGGPTQVVVLGGIWVPPEYAAPPMIYGGPHPTQQQLMHPFHVYKASSSSSQYGGSLHYSDIKPAAATALDMGKSDSRC